MATQTGKITIDGRVGRLEGAFENLVKEVQETSHNVRELTTSMGGFREDVMNHLGRASAPRWPLILGIGMLVLTIITLGGTVASFVFSGMTATIQRVETVVELQQKEISDIHYKEGEHSTWRTTIDKSLDNLNTKIAHEMQLHDEASKARDDSIGKEMVEVKGLIGEVKSWRLNATETLGETKAKIDMMEKGIKLIEDRQHENTVRVNGGKP